MIQLRALGHLTVSAASGCVVRGDRLYVVADDDVELHTYTTDGAPLSVTPLFPEAMPADAGARKKVKPDLESLTALPDGSLLALGSGSGPHRRRGAWIRDGAPVLAIDLGPLFARLGAEFPQLNLEGAAVQGDALVLAQRGNGAQSRNALVRLSLAEVLAALPRGALPASVLRDVRPLELGALDGVPLTITDLAPAPDGTLRFSAAAEDTDDPFLDGEVSGSMLGALAASGEVAWLEPLSEHVKIEGLAHLRGDEWLLVADADDPAVSAPLFAVSLYR